MSYFKRFCTFYTSKFIFQLLPKNWIVNLGSQNWLITYIVLSLSINKFTEFLKWDNYPEKKVRDKQIVREIEREKRERRKRERERDCLLDLACTASWSPMMILPWWSFYKYNILLRKVRLSTCTCTSNSWHQFAHYINSNFTEFYYATFLYLLHVYMYLP